MANWSFFGKLRESSNWLKSNRNHSPEGVMPKPTNSSLLRRTSFLLAKADWPWSNACTTVWSSRSSSYIVREKRMEVSAPLTRCWLWRAVVFGQTRLWCRSNNSGTTHYFHQCCLKTVPSTATLRQRMDETGLIVRMRYCAPRRHCWRKWRRNSRPALGAIFRLTRTYLLLITGFAQGRCELHV